ncbi:CENPE (predicted) [Pycnogonum litorale]
MMVFAVAQHLKKIICCNYSQFCGFRDSILTRILKSSLGGNARTVIICAITPAELVQTHSTLKFASNAKIKNQPHINEVPPDEAQMKKFKKKIAEPTKLLEV